MKEKYTHIAMILDRSGSMGSTWGDVLGGYKTIVEDNKAAEGECTMTVTVFDDFIETIENFTPIKDVKDELTIRPRGSTALLDAIGTTIVKIGEKLSSLDESERPEKVLVIVQTDGQENASKEYTSDRIKEMVNEQQEKYNWQFQFVGATLESVKDAQKWGFIGANTSSYSLGKSADTFALLSKKSLCARSANMNQYAASVAFSEEDKKEIN